MDFCESCASPFILEVMASIVLFEKVRGIQLVLCFPGVIGFRVTFPFEEILKSFVLPKVLMTPDSFYFVVHFPIYQVRRGPCEVGTVGRCLDEWG